MMLSTNPLIAQDKVAEKEKELQRLKDEIDSLDIKIKKLKCREELSVNFNNLLCADRYE